MTLSVQNYSNGEDVKASVLNRPIDEIVTYINNIDTNDLSVASNILDYGVDTDVGADFLQNVLIPNDTVIVKFNNQMYSLNRFSSGSPYINSNSGTASSPGSYTLRNGKTFNGVTFEGTNSYHTHTQPNINNSGSSTYTTQFTIVGDKVIFVNMIFDLNDTSQTAKNYIRFTAGAGADVIFWNCKFTNTGNHIADVTPSAGGIIYNSSVSMYHCSYVNSPEPITIQLEGNSTLITDNTYFDSNINVNVAPNTPTAKGIWVDRDSASPLTTAPGTFPF